MPVSPSYTPKSASVGLIQNLPWDLVGSITAQYVERAPKPAELFSGGGHDATVTFDKGNANLKIEAAQSLEVGLRRAKGPFRFEATAYYTKFNGFIYRRLTGNTCDGDTGVCGPGAGDLNEAIYSQADATFRGGEFQSQWDLAAARRRHVRHRGPVRRGARDLQRRDQRAAHSAGAHRRRRVTGATPTGSRACKLLHAFAQNNIAPIAETPTPGYDDLRAELSYKWKPAKPRCRRSQRSDGRHQRQQSAQPRYPQQRVLFEGRGADAGRQRAAVREGEVLK